MARDLLESLAKSPHDPDLRVVVADALLERGGPRAELVALEAARRDKAFDKKRELRFRELVAEHRADWAGALDRWLLPDNRVFEGGFVVAGSLATTKGLAAALSAPEWRLIRDLELPADASVEEALGILTHPAMVSLRGLHGLSWEMGRALATCKDDGLTPVTSVGLRHIGGDPNESHVLDEVPALPTLRRIVLDCRAARAGADWDRFTREGVGGRIREIELIAGGEIVGWLPRLAGTEVETFTMNLGSEGGPWAAEGGWRLSLERRSLRMKATWVDGADVEKPTADGLGRMLMNWQNPADRTASIAVDEAVVARMAPAERRHLDAIVKHVGVTAEVREEKRAREHAQLEVDNFHRSHHLYVDKTGRFYFDIAFTLYTGKLGSPSSVKSRQTPIPLTRYMREKGIARTRSAGKLADALRTLGRDVPEFLLKR